MAQATERGEAIFGALFMAIGAGLYTALRITPEAANAPPWVIDSAAGAFFFAGLSVVARSLRWTLAAQLAGVLVVYLLAVPGLWMMFADDPSCSVSGAIGGALTAGTASSLACRVVFGGGGLVVLLAAIGYTVAFFRRKPESAAPPNK